MTKLSFHTAVHSIKQFTDESCEMLCQYGLNPEEMKLLLGKKSWKASERPMIERAFRNLAFASLDVDGLPRIDLPAEYIAGIIACVIAPPNQKKAALWMEGGASAEAMGNSPDSGGIEKASSQQLFALVCQMYSHPIISECCDQWENAVNKNLGKARNIEQEANNGKAKNK